MTTRHLPLAALLIFAATGVAGAQPVPAGNPWSRGTTFDVYAGVSTAAEDTRPVWGGAAGWEISPFFGVEGSAAWFDREGDAEAFAATLSGRANLTGRHRAVPFVKGGIGLYRASFGTLSDVRPDFYRRRISAGDSAATRSFTFTDPSFVVSAGIDLFTSRHISVHPEVGVTLVHRDAQTQSVAGVTMHVSYHFEDHPITPERTRR